jgi:hypothetical protein
VLYVNGAETKIIKIGVIANNIFRLSYLIKTLNMELDEFVSIAKKNTGKSSGKDYLLFDSL